MLDVAPIARLLERIVDRWRPEQVWLFGSRARGDATPESDGDLLAGVARAATLYRHVSLSQPASM